MEPEIVDTVDNDFNNASTNSPFIPTLNPEKKHTNKHQVRWHHTIEATIDNCNESNGFHDFAEGSQDDFGPKFTIDELPQSHPARQKKRT